MLYCIYRCCRTSQPTVYGLLAAFPEPGKFTSLASLRWSRKPCRNLGDVQTGTKSSWTTFKGAMKFLVGCIHFGDYYKCFTSSAKRDGNGRRAGEGVGTEAETVSHRDSLTASAGAEADFVSGSSRSALGEVRMQHSLRVPEVTFSSCLEAWKSGSLFKHLQRKRFVRPAAVRSTAALAHCRYLLRPSGSLVPRCRRAGLDKMTGSTSKFDLCGHAFSTRWNDSGACDDLDLAFVQIALHPISGN